MWRIGRPIVAGGRVERGREGLRLTAFQDLLPDGRRDGVIATGVRSAAPFLPRMDLLVGRVDARSIAHRTRGGRVVDRSARDIRRSDGTADDGGGSRIAGSAANETAADVVPAPGGAELVPGGVGLFGVLLASRSDDVVLVADVLGGQGLVAGHIVAGVNPAVRIGAGAGGQQDGSEGEPPQRLHGGHFHGDLSSSVAALFRF